MIDTDGTKLEKLIQYRRRQRARANRWRQIIHRLIVLATTIAGAFL